MDPRAERALPRGRGRHQPLAGDADDLPRADRGAERLQLHHQARAGVPRRLARAAERDARRPRVARPAALLRVLGADAGADVHAHRRVGRQRPHLRGGEALPVHDGRLGADADRHPLPLLPGRTGRLRRRHHDRRWTGARLQHAALALCRLRAGLPDQGPALPLPHLAAGRARPGAHGEGQSSWRPSS